MEKLQLVEKLSKYEKDGNLLYVFPNLPFWFVSSSRFDIFMNQLQKGISKEDLFKNLNKNSISLIEKLIDIGIISVNGERKDNLERIVPKKRIWDVYDVCEFELTLKCNLRCTHCYISAGVCDDNEITLNEINNVLDDLEKLHKKDMRGKRIVLTGGEPFIRKDILEIIEEITKRGFQILINSNGLIISDEKIEKLKKYNNMQICISLDGLKESHEKIRGKKTFERTVNKIRKLQVAGINTSINMLCHKKNFHELEALFELTQDMKLHGINPVPVVLMGRAKEFGITPVPEKDFYRGIFEILKKNPKYSELMRRTSFVNLVAGLAVNVKSHYCGTGSRGTFFISYDGGVYPCPNMRFANFSLGNIRKKSFFEIVKNNPIIKKLGKLSVDNMNETCKNCDLRYFCGGFCRGETFCNTKNIKSPYVRCEEYKEGLIEALWILAENPEFFEKRAKEFYENSKQLAS